MTDENDYLLISGIQHFTFCRRQWALIHIEQAWTDNALTVSGEILHQRAHNRSLTEKRGDIIITRGMPVVSHAMRARGVCDVVEFRKDKNGVTLFGRQGLWMPCPVEYKRGGAKAHNADSFQLCAQAMCLEEMLLCPQIQTAFLYYSEPNRREEVALGDTLREGVRSAFAEIRGYYERQYTPRVKPHKGCSNCSLRDMCLPKMPQKNHVAAYIKNALSEQ